MSLRNLKLHITNNHKAIIMKLIKNIIPNNEVWAYGSCVCSTDIATHDVFDGSDLDLVVLGTNAPMYDLKQSFADCNVPYNIDVIAMETILDSIKSEIHKKYMVLWNGKHD